MKEKKRCKIRQGNKLNNGGSEEGNLKKDKSEKKESEQGQLGKKEHSNKDNTEKV